MESFRDAASKETCFSLCLQKGNFLTFYTIILAITFYCDGKKEHLFRRISVTIEIPRKKLKKKPNKITSLKMYYFLTFLAKKVTWILQYT